MKRFFGARAIGGITPAEADRRQAAVEQSLLGEGRLKPLPPPILRISDGKVVAPTPTDELVLVGVAGVPIGVFDGPGFAPAAGAAPAAVEEIIPAVEPAPRPRRQPDNPVVTIEISGPHRAGKSILAHLIRSALSHEGIAASGPEGLASARWHRALDMLANRGLSVVLVERETGEEDDGA